MFLVFSLLSSLFYFSLSLSLSLPPPPSRTSTKGNHQQTSSSSRTVVVQRKKPSPQPLQASPLICKLLFIPLPLATNASYQPHHLLSHRAPPAMPPSPFTPDKPPSSLILLLFPPFSAATACKQWNVNYNSCSIVHTLSYK